ncbi:MAG TPA: flagellar assembly protein T N-terminal domain-containing protein [Marinobacter sp.]|nr:flagellar assembly protein T N-terminal domain-containing protein [Marinobacter sp.]
MFVMLMLWCLTAQAVVLEGIGHGTIVEGNLEQARADARQAAMRDLALQYEARVSTEDTMENGKLTYSHTRLSAEAQVHNATIVDEYRSGNLLRVIVRAELSSADAAGRGASCKAGAAAGLRKRVAVTGFPILHAEQGGNRSLDDASEQLPQALVARLQERGEVQVLGATRLNLLSDPQNAPTSRAIAGSNHLTNVVQVARELGAQFVVSGVIRDMGLSDPGAWGTSILARLKRHTDAVDTRRRFEAELLIFDGFSGSLVFSQRFLTSAEWQPAGPASAGLANAGLENSAWGKAVSGVIDQMSIAVSDALTCQPFMVRIARVDGKKVTLENGAIAGLRPGDELKVYRSRRYFDSLTGTPELMAADASITLDNVHPDFSTGWLDIHAGQINVQRDDVAIIW